jgi:hypothetical protein
MVGSMALKMVDSKVVMTVDKSVVLKESKKDLNLVPQKGWKKVESWEILKAAQRDQKPVAVLEYEMAD